MNLCCDPATDCAEESAMRSRIVRSAVDRGTAGTRHPDTVAIDAAVKLAAVLVLLEEGKKRVEQHHGRLIASRSCAPQLRIIVTSALSTRRTRT